MFTFKKNTFFAYKLNIYDTSSVTNAKQKKKKRKAKATTVKTDYLSRGLFLPSLNKLYGKTTYV